jgi:ElaB/YqjD/DUF883 family membrane-anchored ribosome-binding protein
MAKHSSHILDMARKGAEHRYEELKAEIAQLVMHFPHLASRAGDQIQRRAKAVARRGKAAVAAITSAVTPKKRRKMSAKARKAIGDAQRKRWAAQKSGPKK